MTAQVDSQPVTDQNMWYIDMCCINKSISCLEKKMTVGTHEQSCLVIHKISNVKQNKKHITLLLTPLKIARNTPTFFAYGRSSLLAFLE